MGLVDQRKINVLENQFYEAILDSFQNYNSENAIFLAERFKNISDNEKSRCILAECYLMDKKFYNVYELLKGFNGDRAKFIFAKSCLHINKLREAERVLFGDNELNYTKKLLDKVVNGSQGLYLLGQIC